MMALFCGRRASGAARAAGAHLGSGEPALAVPAGPYEEARKSLAWALQVDPGFAASADRCRCRPVVLSRLARPARILASLVGLLAWLGNAARRLGVCAMRYGRRRSSVVLVEFGPPGGRQDDDPALLALSGSIETAIAFSSSELMGQTRMSGGLLGLTRHSSPSRGRLSRYKVCLGVSTLLGTPRPHVLLCGIAALPWWGLCGRSLAVASAPPGAWVRPTALAAVAREPIGPVGLTLIVEIPKSNHLKPRRAAAAGSGGSASVIWLRPWWQVHATCFLTSKTRGRSIERSSQINDAARFARERGSGGQELRDAVARTPGLAGDQG